MGCPRARARSSTCRRELARHTAWASEELFLKTASTKERRFIDFVGPQQLRGSSGGWNCKHLKDTSAILISTVTQIVRRCCRLSLACRVSSLEQPHTITKLLPYGSHVSFGT